MNSELNIFLHKHKDFKHHKCKLIYDQFTGDYDCGYNTILVCEECKYGLGHKNPEAKCNTNNNY